MSANDAQEVQDAHADLARVWKTLRHPEMISAAAAVYAVQYQLEKLQQVRDALPPLSTLKTGPARAAQTEQRAKLDADEVALQRSMARLLEREGARVASELLEEVTGLINRLDEDVFHIDAYVEEQEEEHPRAPATREAKDVTRLIRGAYTGAELVDSNGRATLLAHAHAARRAAQAPSSAGATPAEPTQDLAEPPRAPLRRHALLSRMESGSSGRSIREARRAGRRATGESRLRSVESVEETLARGRRMGLRAGWRYFGRGY
ncbi:hypothetical protein JCM10449v2_008016 [Rhodotorula kratochvilovae]